MNTTFKKRIRKKHLKLTELQPFFRRQQTRILLFCKKRIKVNFFQPIRIEFHLPIKARGTGRKQGFKI